MEIHKLLLKSKVQCIAYYEGSEAGWSYSSNFLNLGGREGVVNATPQLLYTRKCSDNHSIGRWVEA